MKKRTKKVFIIGILLVLIVGLIVVGKKGISKDIEKTVDVIVHTNTQEDIPTTINIDGSITKTLFPTHYSFEGVFEIPYIEKSCSNNAQALISWSSNSQSYAIFDDDTFSMVPIQSIKMSFDMESIMLAFNDGTVIENIE